MLKIIIISCLFCAIPPMMIQYVRGQHTDDVESKTYSDNANTNLLTRYVLEEDFKPAIFGSFKYDPIRQIFVINGRDVVDTGSSTNAAVITTAAHTAAPQGKLILRNSSVEPSWTASLAGKRRGSMVTKKTNLQPSPLAKPGTPKKGR